jgi:hypothetical protein
VLESDYAVKQNAILSSYEPDFDIITIIRCPNEAFRTR